VAFRAVFLPAGAHTVVFRYRPAGFEPGLALSGCGILLAMALWFWPPRMDGLAPDHADLSWPRRWRVWFFGALAGLVIVSAIGIGPGGRPAIHQRWRNSFHTFTWGSGTEAMRVNRQ
jgi:hypothetical protein